MMAADFPLDLRLALTSRVRLSPFFDTTVAAGATHFSTYNHMLLPVSYGDLGAEYRRLTEAVALWDVSVQRQIAVTGPDAARLAQRATTRDLSEMVLLQGKYAPMCDHRGRLLNDPVLLRRGAEEFWFSIADNDVVPWLSAIAGEGQFDVDVEELDVATLALQGPRAEDTVAALLGDWVRTIAFFNYATAELEGMQLLVGRGGWSKQGGFELHLLDPEAAHDLWRLAMDVGATYGIGPGAPNTVERLESGLFSLRTDAPADATPFEVGLSRWVELDSAVSFIGKPALAELKRAGPARQLVAVKITGELGGPVIRPVPVLSGDAVVGTLQAAAMSPRAGWLLGVSLVALPHNQPGTELSVELDGERRQLSVLGPFGVPRSRGGFSL